ncbi:hypothetical protein POL68_13565 [Stigmatella sp. ncwal1]|uniref:Uncharacterized protein n=1 Tax=Stigmatella ashevillensis TaxID=2995309 RepID=A0ABT5D758_9BACT|nr:hypothetical protein [Stigmatella ashevillena]MDC0709493.1 hypothetical protein [Stigmatella ashevillena]
MPGWPPKAPEGKKPKLGTKGAAEWRYERYRHQQFKKGRKQVTVHGVRPTAPLHLVLEGQASATGRTRFGRKALKLVFPECVWHLTGWKNWAFCPPPARERLPWKQEDLLDFETYKRRHYKAAAEGGRPGRSGGGNQVKTRQFLEQNEGFQNTETTVLNDKYVDLIKPNEKGGVDYVEVDAMLKKGTPIKRLREKLKIELDGLKEEDRLIYIDKLDPSKRIIYEYGDKPSVVDTKTWKD